MGYDTEFSGAFTVDPPLNAHEIAYLRDFSVIRHMDRTLGPYYRHDAALGHSDIDDRNQPGPDQPGLWCDWMPSPDGEHIVWNGSTRARRSEYWMVYLIQTFLQPGARLAAELDSPVPGRHYAAEFAHFTFDHVLNGQVDAQGEIEDDKWRIQIVDNVVTVRSEDGKLSDPIVEAVPRGQALLRGGTHDGEIHTLRVERLHFLILPDGSWYEACDSFDSQTWDGVEPVVLTPVPDDRRLKFF